MKPTILLFEFSKIQFTKLTKQLFPMKFRIKQIRSENYMQPIGFLAGIKEIEGTDTTHAGEALSDPMMIMCGLSSFQIDQVLAAIRRSGAGPIPYKAVLTPSNQTRNAFMLLEELKEEHKKMHS